MCINIERQKMVCHVVNKSIANFIIYNTETEFQRMLLTTKYYQIEKREISLSRFVRDTISDKKSLEKEMSLLGRKQKLVEIVAYCLMPTHPHFILEELKKGGIAKFIGNTLNSYARYFNLKHKRKGPLWEGRSKKVLVKTDEQLLHLTRYVHLNPVTAYIVECPEKWRYSSYNEYISEGENNKKICTFDHVLSIKHSEYKKFVNEGISNQRECAKIKKLTLK